MQTTGKTANTSFTAFDKKALSPVKGKFIAFGIILVIFLLSMIFAGVISGIASAILTPLAALLVSCVVYHIGLVIFP